MSPSAPGLLDELTRAVMAYFQPQSRTELPGLCDSIGLPCSPDDPALSKAKYLRARLGLLEDSDVRAALEKLLSLHGAALPAQTRFDLEEALWTRYPPFLIPKKHRRELANRLDGTPLFLNGDRFIRALGELWILEDSFEAFVGQLGGRRGKSLRSEIEQHVVRNPEDWPVEYLFDRLGAFDVSDQRFALFIEALASPDVCPDEPEQRAFAERVNSVLGAVGVELREVDLDGGYPVFRFARTSQMAGRPKNLIFASSVKPDLRLRDAVNNDVEVVNGGDRVLILDRPIPAEGLKWRDLQAWWAEVKGLDAAQAKSTLYKRLLACLPKESPAQRRLFETYYQSYGPRVPDLPALLPEVWLHWDPKTVRERGAEALFRFRMDFLMLFSHEARVVIEVDGKQHYTDNSGRGDPDQYAAMMEADRDLRLSGYEVYRFGASELDEQSMPALKVFFDRLLARHGLRT